MTAAELKQHVEISGWETVAGDLTAGIELRERFREALEKIVHGGYAEGSDRAHPAIALARDTLDPKWRERAAAHYPKPRASALPARFDPPYFRPFFDFCL